MNFLRNLFSGGDSSTDQRALYIYVRPKRCNQIVEVRINLIRDLSIIDDGDGYWMRKVAQAVRCPFPAEITLYFDKNRNLVSQEVTNGELVERETYDAWITETRGEAESSARGST